MSESKHSQELIDMFNKALEDEHQAYIQYLSHAEIIDGLNSEPIIARIKEIAEDEEKHQEIFRDLIGNYLGGVPSMGISPTTKAKTIEEILKVNLAAEKAAVDFYTKIMEKIKEEKENLPYEFWKLEHDVRHVIMDEQEHIAELRQLLGE
ncbi:MAG: hypothetical protein A3J62_00225 [Candidatus Buchananbacteria bacterium RIFCSPHIGHO2_02_FULL_38_8]|uniref:Ferritin-like diiron domain-containing protein n=2 Tax=Candidatus Buchananiibacteriota TaxID=1817903 RepID=A0A1G1Y185_9BACT|nr:MAG: hypothetical protein A2731_04370 [Candidatus Buchananbacteria bacterium RIFCSPHIGHO2_01_FULL_39_8]OGY47861.1 MAG: hypothetical protein A3J62_00225 [Candidatus Buchananbacteria bacterium RIFCSPHIGHO2_02_FULL_38_8]